MMFLVLGSLSETVPAVMGLSIPILALMIPIVVTLTKHQQRMTEILRGAPTSEDVESIRREVSELRALVHQQAFTLDRIHSSQPASEVERLRIG